MSRGDKVGWHVLGMGNEQVHTAHWHGKTLRFRGATRT